MVMPARWFARGRLLAARDELERLKLERLRAALVEGERSGLVEDFAMDELIADDVSVKGAI
jgi:hypothetical protein